MVEYRKIPNFSNYLVGNDGTVWSCFGRGLQEKRSNFHEMSKVNVQSGYKHVWLFENGKAHNFAIHRLVLICFVGPCPDGMECLHKDGNPSNNNLDNLRWGTRLENQRDKESHGNLVFGIRHGMCKIDEQKVNEIFKLRYIDKLTQKEISEKFGIDRKMVGNILNGKNWKHLNLVKIWKDKGYLPIKLNRYRNG